MAAKLLSNCRILILSNTPNPLISNGIDMQVIVGAEAIAPVAVIQEGGDIIEARGFFTFLRGINYKKKKKKKE